MITLSFYDLDVRMERTFMCKNIIKIEPMGYSNGFEIETEFCDKTVMIWEYIGYVVIHKKKWKVSPKYKKIKKVCKESGIPTTKRYIN